MALTLVLNGREQVLDGLEDGAGLGRVIVELGLKADRVAVEHNGKIVRRGSWDSVEVRQRDKLEVVHFVGGGARQVDCPCQSSCWCSLEMTGWLTH